MRTKENDNKEIRINVRMTNGFRKKYKMHCLKKDISLSDRIRQLMEMDLNGEIK